MVFLILLGDFYFPQTDTLNEVTNKMKKKTENRQGHRRQIAVYWSKQLSYECKQANVTRIRIGSMEKSNNLPPLDSTWLSLLRQRFAEIAARRVPADAVEDIVQDALGIVLAKGPSAAHEEGLTDPPLRWSFNVLRNVIGNWYQKRRRHETVEDLDLPDDCPDALAALTAAERMQSIHEAMEELRQKKPLCAQWLWAMAEGTKAGILAAKARMAEAVFYRKIYRCRQSLAGILAGRGLAP